MKITYKELQSNLKNLRSASVNIQCKLSSSKVALEACYLNLIREGLVHDLKEVDLSATDLRGANLRGVNLKDANLNGAYLRGADLSDAYLKDTDLRGADLSGADLYRAFLRGADLSGANLSGTKLSHAKLSGATLRNVDLSDACLISADLRFVDLRGADLRGADLCDVVLSGTIGYKPVTKLSIDLILRVAKIVVKDKNKLVMDEVHTCDSIHCAGGWICSLDSEAEELEEELGWNVAACTVCPVPEFTGLFYSSNEEMLDFLTLTLEDNGQSLREKYLV